MSTMPSQRAGAGRVADVLDQPVRAITARVADRLIDAVERDAEQARELQGHPLQGDYPRIANNLIDARGEAFGTREVDGRQVFAVDLELKALSTVGDGERER